jgi:predicted acyltransferase
MLIVGLAVTLVGMVVSGLLPIDRWGPAVVLLVVADALGLVGLVSETLEGN